MLKKLRIRFVCVILAIVTVMLCSIFGLLYHSTAQNLEEESLSMMRTVAANPFQLGRPNSGGTGVHLPYFLLKISATGELTAVVGGYYDLSDQVFLTALMEAATAKSGDTGVIPEYNLRFLKVRSPLSETIVFADMSSELMTLHHLLKHSLIVGMAGFLLLLAISIWLSGWAVRPVERAWKQQKQFVADASHELKTPLTVILSNAELLEGAGLAEKPARWSGNIHTEAEQMRTLVEQMLTLARADNGVRPAAMEPLNLSDVATDCVLAFEPVAFEAGKPLEERITADVTVVGDADRLRRLISILLDNAVKYGAEGGHITLTLEKTDRQARLTVSNPGDPIPPEHLAHLFERFYRADASRGEKSGFGLGLAIADTIAREHKGALKAESDAASTRFIFTMPLKKQA